MEDELLRGWLIHQEKRIHLWRLGTYLARRRRDKVVSSHVQHPTVFNRNLDERVLALCV
jgi:hypothetical protein